MNNQGQSNALNMKLLNKLANAEYDNCRLETQIDELNQKIQQLTQANQQLQAKAEAVKQEGK